jgi:hypothetical protein
MAVSFSRPEKWFFVRTCGVKQNAHRLLINLNAPGIGLDIRGNLLIFIEVTMNCQIIYQTRTMKQKCLLLCFVLLFSQKILWGKSAAPDTVKTGVYITSIHDIDFKQNEYTINLWLWLRYKNKDFDFAKNLEIPQAKSFEMLYVTIDSSQGGIYMLMKLQCVMKDNWRINNFPFDKQRLRLAIENSQYDSRELVFAADTAGNHFDPRFTLRGWRIDSFTMSAGIKAYETTFGDTSFKKPRMEYGTFRIRMQLHRDVSDLFAKIFLGMYVAFLISFICFFIHADYIDSRFGLSVGALFAAIGNKYIIDSSLPESTSFTLVDSLHGITLFFIFAVTTASVFSLQLVKRGKIATAKKFDYLTALIMLAVYVILNVWLILNAQSGTAS